MMKMHHPGRQNSLDIATLTPHSLLQWAQLSPTFVFPSSTRRHSSLSLSGHKSRLRNAREAHHRVTGRVQVRIDGERSGDGGGGRRRVGVEVVVQQRVDEHGVKQLHGRGLRELRMFGSGG